MTLATPEPSLGFGLLSFSGWWAGGSSGGLVVAGGVEGEVSEEFSGVGVDDAVSQHHPSRRLPG